VCDTLLDGVVFIDSPERIVRDSDKGNPASHESGQRFRNGVGNPDLSLAGPLELVWSLPMLIATDDLSRDVAACTVPQRQSDKYLKMRCAAPYLFPQGARLGEQNLVLHASARRHSVHEYAGPLSVKTVLRGRVSWVVDGRGFVVCPASFLVLAAGERYSMEIDEISPVETCCAFFASGFLEEIAIDLTSSVASALDTLDRIAPPLAYLSAVHGDQGCTLTNRVANLADRCERQLNPSAMEEDFLALGIALIEFYQQIRAQADRLSSLRLSTRQELFRRLLIGRDYIHSHCTELVSLANVARSACLSLFHFHRGFTLAFQETPHSYLTGLRLRQAGRMIERGASVLEACVAVGFSSPSALSRLFRARLGQSPSQVRRKLARSGKNGPAFSGNIGACSLQLYR
jgi:AraC family transcriptional regulator